LQARLPPGRFQMKLWTPATGSSPSRILKDGPESHGLDPQRMGHLGLRVGIPLLGDLESILESKRVGDLVLIPPDRHRVDKLDVRTPVLGSRKQVYYDSYE
jgi:hypothetical protein